MASPVVATPNWDGATAGQTPLAAQVNQFLGAHAVTFIYTGTQIGAQTTLGSGSTASNGLYMAQSFTTPASPVTLGRIVLDLSLTGSPAPLTVSIRTNSGSAPSATVVATVQVPKEYTTGIVTIPLPASLSASTTYWIVTTAVGDASDFYAWLRSNQTSGASTSTNGTSWTAQTYGFYYAYFDQTLIRPLRHTWEDSGARWTQTTWNANGTPSLLQSYTVAQGSGQYAYSSRSPGYSGQIMTSVS